MSEAQLSLWGGTTGADYQTELEQKGFVLLDQKIPAEVIDAYISAYADFTDNLPDPEPATMNAMIKNVKNLDRLDYSKDKQKEWHKYRTNTPHFAKPNGYTNRSFQVAVLENMRGTEQGDDPKEYFHYTPGMREEVAKRHQQYGWGATPPELERLMSRAHSLHYFAKTAMTGFYATLQESHPDLARFVRPQDLDISPLRGLFYHHGQGDELAGGHHDRGLGTLQIAESHLGLRVRNPATDEMDLVERDPEYGIAFPALKWRSAFPDSNLRSLWHDVINVPTACKDRVLHGQNVARWSIILFTNSQEIGDQNVKNLTHTEANTLVA